jgi:hypothetical protein
VVKERFPLNGKEKDNNPFPLLSKKTQISLIHEIEM